MSNVAVRLGYRKLALRQGLVERLYKRDYAGSMSQT